MADKNRQIIDFLINKLITLNITECKIMMKENSIILNANTNLKEELSSQAFVCEMSNTKLQIILQKDILQRNITIQHQKIVKEMFRVIKPVHQETISILLDLEEVWNVTDGVIMEIKNAFPSINIQIELRKNNKVFSEESIQYSYQCQIVSSSIASILAYSLNPDFRKHCEGVLELNKYPKLSSQEVIAQKLMQINKNL